MNACFIFTFSLLTCTCVFSFTFIQVTIVDIINIITIPNAKYSNPFIWFPFPSLFTNAIPNVVTVSPPKLANILGTTDIFSLSSFVVANVGIIDQYGISIIV